MTMDLYVWKTGVIFAGAFIMLVAVLTTGAVAYQAWQERSSRAP